MLNPFKIAKEAVQGLNVHKVVDDTTTSLDERQQAMNERLRIDTSGSWLQRNIRPLIVLWCLAIMTLSGYDLIKPEKWLQETVSEGFKLALMFYFVERGLRHLIKARK